MGQRLKEYQHQPLRVPARWKDEERALVIQLERLLDQLYIETGRLRDETEALKARVEELEE